jgi:hypothetical protein
MSVRTVCELFIKFIGYVFHTSFYTCFIGLDLLASDSLVLLV